MCFYRPIKMLLMDYVNTRIDQNISLSDTIIYIYLCVLYIYLHVLLPVSVIYVDVQENYTGVYYFWGVSFTFYGPVLRTFSTNEMDAFLLGI